MVANEQNNSKLMEFTKGTAISLQYLYDRCSFIHFYTEICRRKNYVAMSIPCSGDSRNSGNASKVMDCTVIGIDIKAPQKHLVQNNILENIGREIDNSPTIVTQVLFWSFYDRNYKLLTA